MTDISRVNATSFVVEVTSAHSFRVGRLSESNHSLFIDGSVKLFPKSDLGPSGAGLAYGAEPNYNIDQFTPREYYWGLR